MHSYRLLGALVVAVLAVSCASLDSSQELTSADIESSCPGATGIESALIQVTGDADAVDITYAYPPNFETLTNLKDVNLPWVTCVNYAIQDAKGGNGLGVSASLNSSNDPPVTCRLYVNGELVETDSNDSNRMFSAQCEYRVNTTSS